MPFLLGLLRRPGGDLLSFPGLRWETPAWSCRAIIGGGSGGYLSPSRVTRRPDMENDRDQSRLLELQGPDVLNAPLRGFLHFPSREKIKKTKHKAPCPEPLQLEKSPQMSPGFKWPPPQPSPRPEACCGRPPHRPPPSLGRGQLRKLTTVSSYLLQAQLGIRSTGPGAGPNLRSRTLLSAYLVVKVCLISSRLSLPVTGLCFYKGSLFLLGKEVQSPEVPGSGSSGRGSFPVKQWPCASPGSAAVWALWEPWGGGAGGKGWDDPGHQACCRARGR